MLITYQNGEREVFNTSSAARSYVNAPNLKYKELIQTYDFRDYTPGLVDKYSPGWCGVASFFIPGLGQAICNEWGRACGYFFGNIALSSLGSAFASGYANNYEAPQTYAYAALMSYAAAFALDICSIVDAVRVARVKNMYYRDIANASTLSIKFEPTFAYAPTGVNQFQPTAGMALKISF